MMRPFRRMPMRRACSPRRTPAARPVSCTPCAEQFEDPPEQNSWRLAARAGGAGLQPSPPRRAPSARPRRRPSVRRPHRRSARSATFVAREPPCRRAAHRGRSGVAGTPRPHARLAHGRGVRAARSSSTGACSTGRWIGTGDRSASAGIGLSNYGYSEVEAGFDLGTRTLRLHMLARPLQRRGLTRQPGPSLLLCPPGGRSRLRPSSISACGKPSSSRASTASSTGGSAIP